MQRDSDDLIEQIKNVRTADRYHYYLQEKVALSLTPENLVNVVSLLAAKDRARFLKQHIHLVVGVMKNLKSAHRHALNLSICESSNPIDEGSLAILAEQFNIIESLGLDLLPLLTMKKTKLVILATDRNAYFQNDDILFFIKRIEKSNTCALLFAMEWFSGLVSNKNVIDLCKKLDAKRRLAFLGKHAAVVEQIPHNEFEDLLEETDYQLFVARHTIARLLNRYLDSFLTLHDERVAFVLAQVRQAQTPQALMLAVEANIKSNLGQARLAVPESYHDRRPTHSIFSSSYNSLMDDCMKIAKNLADLLNVEIEDNLSNWEIPSDDEECSIFKNSPN